MTLKDSIDTRATYCFQMISSILLYHKQYLKVDTKLDAQTTILSVKTLSEATIYLSIAAVGLITFLFINYWQLRRIRDSSFDDDEKVGDSLLTRDLSEFDVMMVGVGAMIGAGIFVLTGIAAGIAGPSLILAFLFNGFLTYLTASAYAELGSAVPEAGGGYLWVKSAMGNYQAFLGGWMSWFAHIVAGSLYSLGFGSYLALLLLESHVIGHDIEDLVAKMTAIIIILIFSFINFLGSSETGKAGNIITLMKLMIIGVFILSGLYVILSNVNASLTHFDIFFPKGLTNMLMAMGLTFIAFEGHEIIVQTGEEVINPRKNIPKAIFKSLMIVIPIYVLVSFVALGAISSSDQPTWQFLGENKELGLAEAARQFMPLGITLLLFGGLISTLSALNATTYSSARVSFVMGRDRLLPESFGEVNRWRRTPHMALFASTLIMITVTVFLPIQTVAAAADVMFLLLFLQVNVSLLKIRKKYGTSLKYGYQVPLFPLLPILAILGKIFILAFLLYLEPVAIAGTAIWLLLGTVVWFSYSKKKIQQHGLQDSFALYMIRNDETTSMSIQEEEERTEVLLERTEVLLERKGK